MNLKEYLTMKYAPSKYPIMSKLPLGYNSPKIQMGNTIGVTRNAIVVNPLTGYNVSTGNVMTQFSNGVQVTHGSYGFVGGDTTELTFDFGTKVAGSVVECPLKFYCSEATTLNTPSNITGSWATGWAEEPSQANLDKLKTQEGTSYLLATELTSGRTSQLMIELDLTPVANQLFGGSNSALKSALKYINVDGWIFGSGSNGGVLAYGAMIKCWNGSSWVDWVANYNSSITKSSYTSTSNAYIQSDNKVYFLINSIYSSNGTIASSVSLDYAKITIGLNRTIDTVTNKSVVLPKYWCARGDFSPSFDSTKSVGANRVFSLYTDANNRWSLLRQSTGQLAFAKIKNGTPINLISSSQTFNKYQSYKYLVGQNASGMFMYFLKNNGTVEKVSNTDITSLNGSIPLHLLNQNNLEQGDMFAESFQLYDLQALGRSSTRNMFDGKLTVDYAWSIGGGATAKMSQAGYTCNTNLIPVTPSTMYYLSKDGANASMGNVRFFDSSMVFISEVYAVGQFTTPTNCYYLGFHGATANVTGNLQLEKGSVATGYEPYSRANGFTDYEAESILRGDNKYYVTTTSDFTGKVSGSVVANPNIYKQAEIGSLLSPSGFAWEGTQVFYDNINSLNGVKSSSNTSTNTYIPQQLFSFNLIEIVERKYGTIPNCSTVADKVAWLKAGNVKTLIANWYGYGSMPTGNKAYFCGLYNSSWGSADTHTNGTVTKLYRDVSGSLNGYIQSDGFVHFLAYTDASNGTVASTIYSDYCSLDVTVKTGNTSVYVPNKELAPLFNSGSWSRYNTSDVYSSADGRTLTLVNTWNPSVVTIPVLPNNKYSLKFALTGSNAFFYIKEYYNNVLVKSTLQGTSSQDTTFITTANTNNVMLDFRTATNTTTITYSNVSLKLLM